MHVYDEVLAKTNRALRIWRFQVRVAAWREARAEIQDAIEVRKCNRAAFVDSLPKDSQTWTMKERAEAARQEGLIQGMKVAAGELEKLSIKTNRKLTFSLARLEREKEGLG
jgi:hypothetical protein